VNASVDRIFDNNANNGNFGVQFVEAHDSGTASPALDNVAYAYVLMRAGSPIVYFQAGEFGSVSFPRPGRGDALGGQFGNLITTLVDIHNEYGRGSYLERWIDGDVLVFERSNACLVGLNDRRDGGYDQRTVTTNFSPGLRLKELTGNAANPLVDPNNDIAEVITVGTGGQVTLRVPRNRNANNVQHNRGYVIYGPFNPEGELTVSNVAGVLSPDGPEKPNGTRRLAEISLIQADSFEVRLETVDADPIDDGEDDLALLRINAGMDLNGNGVIDHLDQGFVGFGYENFLTESVSLKSGGVDIGGVQKGLYRQVIDATQLPEGRNYLSVIAFRSRPGGTPPIFQTWRKVLLIDRVPPEMALHAPAPGTAITTSAYQIAVRSVDRTASQVHLFLNQQPGTDVVAMAQAGQGLATNIDRGIFNRTFTNLSAGNQRLDVVAYEPTRPEPSVTTLSVPVVINEFDGLGDMNGDGRVTNRDIFPFVQMVQAGNQFSPAGDLNGDGVVDENDVPLFAEKLLGAGAPQAMVDEMIRLAVPITADEGEGPDPDAEVEGG
jgi:alpha-amylase